MSTIYLVGCGKAKLDRPAPAQELYTGALFQKSMSYALRMHARAWSERADGAPVDVPKVCILSALHGLVWPTRTLAPYDLALASMPHAERLAWGVRVAGELAGVLDETPVTEARIVALAGAPYVGALQYGLAQLTGTIVRVEQPLKGPASGSASRG